MPALEDAQTRTGFIKNAAFSIIATAVPLLALQFFILPNISERMPASAYGLMLTLVGVVTLVTLPAGGSVNNVRLLMNLEYEEAGYCGDFNPLASLMSLVSVIAVSVMTLIYDDGATARDVIGMAAIGLLATVYQYYIVGFRLTLSYGKIVVNSVIQTAGYLLGYRLFTATGSWYWVYIVGYGLSDLYVLLSTRLYREPWKRTPLFATAGAKLAVLAFAALLISSISYIDRLVLYPILGGEAVTIYYVSTLLGKVVCVAITPITGVMLSYFSRMKHLKMNTMTLMLVLSAGVGLLGYVGCILVSRPLLTYLYPQVASEVLRYIHIVTLTCMVDMIASVMNPVVLRFCNTNWQLAIGAFNVATYLVISLLLLSRFGLPGFCAGVLIASLLKLALMLLVFIRSEQKRMREEGAA